MTDRSRRQASGRRSTDSLTKLRTMVAMVVVTILYVATARLGLSFDAVGFDPGTS